MNASFPSASDCLSGHARRGQRPLLRERSLSSGRWSCVCSSHSPRVLRDGELIHLDARPGARIRPGTSCQARSRRFSSTGTCRCVRRTSAAARSTSICRSARWRRQLSAPARRPTDPISMPFEHRGLAARRPDSRDTRPGRGRRRARPRQRAAAAISRCCCTRASSASASCVLPPPQVEHLGRAELESLHGGAAVTGRRAPTGRRQTRTRCRLADTGTTSSASRRSSAASTRGLAPRA